MPRWPEKTNTEECQVGQDKSVILPPSGSIIDAIEDIKDIEIVDKPMHDDYADALAFMEEMVTVILNEDSDPNAENPVQVAVNGTNQFFIRGQAQDVKRKYIEVLARAKRTRISTPEVTDGSGARTNAIRTQTSLRYPFQVIHDSNPKGPAWLKAVLSEAN